FCVAGEGSYRAERVGVAAFAQQTTVEARAYRYAASPLQKTINFLIHILTAAALLLCVFYFVLYLAKDHSDLKLIERVAATITSMVPQGLVLMVTVALTLGAVRMSARGAVVQRLSAVESMASINVLCMDKTGTLTTNQLRLDLVRVLDDTRTEEEVRRLLGLFAALSVDKASKSIQALRAGLGEPAETAELLDQLPFKSQNRYSAVRIHVGAEEHGLARGACGALQPYLAVPPECWQPVWRELLQTGLRLLFFAEVKGEDLPPFQGSLAGYHLRPLALVALSDEL